MPRDPWIRRIEPCRVAYRATTYKDVEQAMKRRPDEAPRDSDTRSEIAAQLTADIAMTASSARRATTAARNLRAGYAARSRATGSPSSRPRT
jgi:hypothetical protein